MKDQKNAPKDIRGYQWGLSMGVRSYNSLKMLKIEKIFIFFYYKVSILNLQHLGFIIMDAFVIEDKKFELENKLNETNDPVNSFLLIYDFLRFLLKFDNILLNNKLMASKYLSIYDRYSLSCWTNINNVSSRFHTV